MLLSRGISAESRANLKYELHLHSVHQQNRGEARCTCKQFNQTQAFNLSVVLWSVTKSDQAWPSMVKRLQEKLEEIRLREFYPQIAEW